MVNAPLCNSLYLFLSFLCHPYILTIFVENFYYFNVYLCCKEFQPVDIYPRLVVKSIPYPKPFVFSLQEGWTATLKAAYKGHLTVLETLIEHYGGNVLHRKKVECMSG